MKTINIKWTLPWPVWFAWLSTSVTFMILKWGGTVTWSWVAVLSPLWGLGAATILMAFLCMLLAVME